MHRFAWLAALALLGSCGGLTINLPGPKRPQPAPPAPMDEPAPIEDPIPVGPYAHLPQRTSFSPMSDVELKKGCYVGDFVLGRAQLDVTGAGLGETVIDGNLVLQTQCEVSNLTVTGDVIFQGHQAVLDNIDFFGRIIDKGTQNRY